MFTGLSALRAAEKKEPSAQDKALQAYLKRYTGEPNGDAQEKKKRKRKKPKGAAASAVNILDYDVTGFEDLREADVAPRQPIDEPEEEEDEPVIANPEEAEALKLQIEKSKTFYHTRDDGSGWVSQQRQQQQRCRQRHDSPANSGGSDKDLSPPRKRLPSNSNGVAAKRQRHELPPAGDMSPPERSRNRHDSPEPPAAGDLPPSKWGRKRHDSPQSASGDISPPRRGRQRHDSPAQAAAGKAGDLSPPRRGRQRHDSPAAAGGRDLSPPGTGRQRHDLAAGASPPRRQQQRQQSFPAADVSPPRRRRHDSPAAADDAADVSPPRRRWHDSPAGDGSPSCRPKRHDSPAAAGGGAGARAAAAAADARMKDGTVAGLVSSKELAQETARVSAEAEQRRLAAAGKGEATVYRDKKTGRVISAEEYAAQVAKAKQKKPPPEEINVAWKGGLAQQRAAMEAAQKAAAEAAKAFNRGFDDDADAELRERDRWGDPMAGKTRKKKGGDGFNLPPPIITEANRAQMEASGFNVPQEVPPHSWLRRGVAAPTNRYNIRPGRHWDGVDRSNGFEKEMFKLVNQRNAQELEARMWAQEDM